MMGCLVDTVVGLHSVVCLICASATEKVQHCCGMLLSQHSYATWTIQTTALTAPDTALKMFKTLRGASFEALIALRIATVPPAIACSIVSPVAFALNPRSYFW